MTIGSPSNERGFTLAEVMVTIIMLGILAAIAIPSWWSVVEARRVDSATNQVAADLRLAHSSAINRLTEWRVVVPANNSPTYQTGSADDFAAGTFKTRSLAEGAGGTQIAAAATIIFNADGSATLPGGASTVTITVQADGGAPNRAIEVSRANSRIDVD